MRCVPSLSTERLVRGRGGSLWVCRHRSGLGCEWLELAGPGDAAVDVCVDGELELVAQTGVADEDEVVVLGEVLQQQLSYVIENFHSGPGWLSSWFRPRCVGFSTGEFDWA
jgi:hypothetical protein